MPPRSSAAVPAAVRFETLECSSCQARGREEGPSIGPPQAHPSIEWLVTRRRFGDYDSPLRRRGAPAVPARHGDAALSPPQHGCRLAAPAAHLPRGGLRTSALTLNSEPYSAIAACLSSLLTARPRPTSVAAPVRNWLSSRGQGRPGPRALAGSAPGTLKSVMTRSSFREQAMLGRTRRLVTDQSKSDRD